MPRAKIRFRWREFISLSVGPESYAAKKLKKLDILIGCLCSSYWVAYALLQNSDSYAQRVRAVRRNRVKFGKSCNTAQIYDTLESPPLTQVRNLRDVWAATSVCRISTIFANGKTEISFESENAWAFSNEVKAWVEDFTDIDAQINWWPLSPRRKCLGQGFARVNWKCVSGTLR